MELDNPTTQSTPPNRARIDLRCSQSARDRFDELGGSKWLRDLLEGENFNEADIARMVSGAIENSITNSMTKQAAGFPERMYDRAREGVQVGDRAIPTEERRREMLAESVDFLSLVERSAPRRNATPEALAFLFWIILSGCAGAIAMYVALRGGR